MRLTRFGHAALLVQTSETRVLIDPGGFSSDETFGLSGLDAIVITHQHPDHVDLTRLPGLLAVNPEAALLAEPQTVLKLHQHSVDGGEWGEWRESAPHRSVAVGDLDLTGIGGRHAVIHPDLERVGNVGVLITADDEPTLFHPGDSYEFTPSGVDVLAVPLSAPWAKVSETVEFVRAVNPSVVVPIHDCTIAERAYQAYWGQVESLGGAEARLLAQDGSTIV